MRAAFGSVRRDVLGIWPWSAPVLLAGFVYWTNGRFLERGVAGLLAIGVVLLAARRPDRSIMILIAGLPFQGLVLAQLYAWGVSAQVVRPLTSWKEALGLGVVIAGVRGFRSDGRRFDRLDILGLAYALIVAAYALVPRLFAASAPIATDARSLGFRQSAVFVILLLACRHAKFPEGFVERAAWVVVAVGAIVAAVAVYEYFFSDSWNHFAVDNVQYIRYRIDILHSPPSSLSDVRRYSSGGAVRAGSVFFNPTPAGFFLVLPLAVVVERRLRSGVRNGAATSLLVLIGTGLALTQTRAALVAAVVVVFLALRPAAGRTSQRRAQFALIFVGVLIVAVPATAVTGLNSRVASTGQNRDESSADHLQSFWDGVDAVSAAPLGRGLGTSAGVGQRLNDGTSTVTENGYLQVGVETGVLAMVLFCALTVVVIRRLNHAVRAAREPGVAAIRGAAAGLAIGALFLPAWNEFAVAWMMWSLAGAALGAWEAADTRTARSAEPALGRL